MSAWQTIETAPKDAEARLLLHRSGYKEHTAVGRWSLTMDDWCRCPFEPFPNVTHWMPLPAPPEPQQKETA